MAVNGILGQSSEQIGTQFSKVSLRQGSPAQLSETTTEEFLSAGEAAPISLSESTKRSSLESALRNLSPLQNYIDTASGAAGRTREVLGKVIQITEQIEAEVDPIKKASLATDGKKLLDELDEIAKAETTNGIKVVGQGPVSYSYSLEQEDPKQNSITVSLPSVALTKSSLGVDSLTASSLQNSTESAQTTLYKAVDIVSGVSAALESATSAVTSVAKAYGESRAADAAVTEESSESFAEKIAGAIKGSDVPSSVNKLDPSRVLSLLENSEESEKEKKLNEERGSESQKSPLSLVDSEDE